MRIYKKVAKRQWKTKKNENKKGSTDLSDKLVSIGRRSAPLSAQLKFRNTYYFNYFINIPMATNTSLKDLNPPSGVDHLITSCKSSNINESALRQPFLLNPRSMITICKLKTIIIGCFSVEADWGFEYTINRVRWKNIGFFLNLSLIARGCDSNDNFLIDLVYSILKAVLRNRPPRQLPRAAFFKIFD